MTAAIGSDPVLSRRVATPDRKGDWIQTYTGKQFWALDPRPDDLDVLDIAAALSKATRYGGHCLRFYSVAEHCVLMYREALRRGYGPECRFARSVLLHDASEAYLIDVPRPIKRSLTNYAEIEDRLMHVIAERFGFDWPMPEEVKALDNAILADEMTQNMAPPPSPWHQIEGGPLGVTLQCWNADRAMVEFLSAAGEVGVLAS